MEELDIVLPKTKTLYDAYKIYMEKADVESPAEILIAAVNAELAASQKPVLYRPAYSILDGIFENEGGEEVPFNALHLSFEALAVIKQVFQESGCPIDSWGSNWVKEWIFDRTRNYVKFLNEENPAPPSFQARPSVQRTISLN